MTHTLEDSVQGTESYELPMKIGHSFLRVSHQEQIKGYGIERQIEQRDEICRKRGITLVETYGNTTRAVSARKGKQRTHGDLGRFFDDLGRKIKPGEYFLVENLDRLSREDPLEAWRHFDAIIVKGVTVITTTNDREYSAALIKNSPWLMHELLGEMQRAHSENEYRSKRIGDARTRSLNDAAKTGKKVSRICPAWLKPIEDDKRNILGFEPVPDRLLVVQRIFELAASGMGQWSIANVLNEPKNKVPPFSTPGSEYDPDNPPEGRWRAGYIGKIISSQSVLGHYVPRKLVEGKYINLEPMLGYYGDPIVELSVFVRANGFRENRDQTGEARQRRGKTHANLFNQICFCASCGSQLLYKTYTGKHRAKGEKGLGKKANTEQSDTTNNKREPRRYLYCERAKVGDGCDKKRAFNLGWLEETVLNNVPHFPLDELFDGAQNSRELRDMDNKIAEATLKLDGLTKQRSNVMELMRTAETPDEATLWRTDLHKLMGSIKTAENNIAALNHKRTHVEASLRSGATAKETIAKLTEELKNPDQGSRFVIRQKLSNLLKTYISQIRFDGENDEITVILHELGLIGYKFWAGKKGGAPKKNPMKLIDSFDLRSQLGDRATGGISPEVFTTNPKTRKHDAGLQNTFDKLVQAKG